MATLTNRYHVSPPSAGEFKIAGGRLAGIEPTPRSGQTSSIAIASRSARLKFSRAGRKCAAGSWGSSSTRRLAAEDASTSQLTTEFNRGSREAGICSP